jgi:alpha-beta hydrolase superfamily lysophospholipase
MPALIAQWTLRVFSYALAAFGAATAILGGMIAVPLKQPPPLTSIIAGSRSLDRSGLPETSSFRARDGTTLAYRSYEPPSPRGNRVAVLVHGSAGHSANMHGVAQALAAAGIPALALDMRGHGRSGTRGDIGYVGQLDDDLADAIAFFRAGRPNARFILVGHSSGGGFALRFAASPQAELFERYVLLAPYLGRRSPTTRRNTGSAHWVEADVPRILALALLRSAKLSCCESLPVLAFALPPQASAEATRRYTYRLFANFGPPFEADAQGKLPAVRRPIVVVSGTADELMVADKYEAVIREARADGRTVLVPGVDHMGLLKEPAALVAIVKAVGEEDTP